MTIAEYRVIGPPGCGKTTWLSRQVQRAVEQDGPESVLVSSLTRTAAAEVAGRRLPIPASAVGTLHAHAYRALGRPELAVDKKTITAWNQDHPRWALSVDGHAPDDPYSEAPNGRSQGDECLEEIDRLRARKVPVEAWMSPLPIREFYRQWQGWKQEHGLFDFTDLIETAAHSVDVAPGDPRYFFLDEAQDMSALEMSLARKWAEQTEQLIVVGDPDQCLYRFRGSDPAVFFEGDAKWTHVLSQSYRVPKAVHGVATAWIERTPGRSTVAYEPRDAAGEVLRRPQWNWKRPEQLVQDVASHVDAGRSVMVLASCGFMLVPLIAELRKLGIPFENRYRRRNGGWNPLASKHGAKDRLLSFLRFDSDAWGEEARNWTALDLHDWLDVCEAKGLLQHGAKAQIGQLASTPNAAEPLPLDTLRRWFEPGVLEDFEVNAFQPQSIDWFMRRLLASKAKPFTFCAAVARRYGGAKLRERPLVTVGTVHSVKGGESQVVYLYPELSRQALAGWSRSVADRSDVRRMFYVGMTRASETLVLCGASKSYMGVDWDS